MRNLLLAISLVFAVHHVEAAVQYEFRQITHSDVENVSSVEFTGRGVIDGDRSRVDFLTGTAYPPGTYVIGTNGSRNLVFVDPSQKAYVEVNTGAVASALAAGKITVANKKVSSVQMPDHPLVAGMPTDHFKITLSYDMTIAFGSLPVTQSITQVIDKWTTSAFENIAESFLAAGNLHTGNPDLDALMDEESSSKGFALRQTVQINTVSHTTVVPGSALKVNRTHSVTREFTITSIEPKASVPATTFMVPPTFHKADPLKDDSQAPPKQLSLEPSAQ